MVIRKGSSGGQKGQKLSIIGIRQRLKLAPSQLLFVSEMRAKAVISWANETGELSGSQLDLNKATDLCAFFDCVVGWIGRSMGHIDFSGEPVTFLQEEQRL